MFTQWNKVAVVLVGLCLTGGSSSAASRESLPVLSILGKVSIEARSTVVPLGLCEGGNCPQPEKYWSMVVTQDDVQYELDEMFAKGSEKQPETIEVMGTLIRQGTQLMLEAKVNQISEKYAIVSEVQKINLVMDVPPPAQVSRLGRAALWTCMERHQADPQYQVEILPVDDSAITTQYEIQVNLMTAGRKKQVARVSEAAARLEREILTFSGSTTHLEIDLQLDQSSNIFVNVPAELRLWKVVPGPIYQFPIELGAKLECTKGGIIF
jgi:hypothetical protein